MLQIFMWDCISALPEPKDYLQIFRFSNFNGKQKIIHEQEQPEFKREYILNLPEPVNAKVYVIDSETYSTMLLAEEYQKTKSHLGRFREGNFILRRKNKWKKKFYAHTAEQ